MSRLLFKLVALVVAVVVGLLLLQFAVSLLGTILQVSIAGVIVLGIASVGLRMVRSIAASKNAKQVLQPGQEVQRAVIERDR